jgi:hypothetical protein
MDVLAPSSGDVHDVLANVDAMAGGMKKALAARRDEALTALTDFVRANEDAERSPNLWDAKQDRLDLVFKLLSLRERMASDEALCVAALKTLKILSRKEENRLAFTRRATQGVCDVLRNNGRKISRAVASEGACVLLNACYERDNVDAVIACGGVEPLVRFLSDGGGFGDDDDGTGTNEEERLHQSRSRPKPPKPPSSPSSSSLRSNAAGAIQSISYTERGRARVRDCDGVNVLVRALRDLVGGGGKTKTATTTTTADASSSSSSSSSSLALARVVGAIHNMTSDAEAVRAARTLGGVPLIVPLLRSRAPSVAGSAAGAAQNMSREAASRRMIRDAGAIPALGELLVVGEVPAQVCAAGALLNILGPELSRGGGGAGSGVRAEEEEEEAEAEATTSDDDSDDEPPPPPPPPPDDGADGAARRRRGLGKLISSALALTMVWDALYDGKPDVRAPPAPA